MFTDKFITGNTVRPDLRYIALDSSSDNRKFREFYIIYNDFTSSDWYPLASFISGSCKILFGTIHAITHLVQGIFDKMNRAQHLQEAGFGAKTAIRGFVALIPFVGNVALLAFDWYRFKQHAKTLKFQKGFILLYEGGQLTAFSNNINIMQDKKIPMDQVINILQGGNKNSSINHQFGGISYKRYRKNLS